MFEFLLQAPCLRLLKQAGQFLRRGGEGHVRGVDEKIRKELVRPWPWVPVTAWIHGLAAGRRFLPCSVAAAGEAVKCLHDGV